MVKKLFILIILFNVSFSLPLLSQQTSGKGKLRGQVLDDDTGEPIEGVTVKLFSTRAKAFLRPYPVTNNKGRWKALFIRGGNWNIDFEKIGYMSRKISFYVETLTGAKKPPCDITLKKLVGPPLQNIVRTEINKTAELFNSGQYKEALEKFLEIYENNKGDEAIGMVNQFIGNCYSNLNDFKTAIEYFKKGFEKYPENTDLIVSIGNSYSNLKEYDNAIEWFNKLDISKITDSGTLYNIGVMYFNKSVFDKAIKYFNKSIELNKEYADSYYQLGMTYTAMNKIPEAITVLNKFMELAPDSPNYNTAKEIVEAFSK